MIISLHDSNLSRVCYIDNSLPDAMHYSDDSWNRYLQEATSTFDFKVHKTGNKYESFLNEKNYVSFSYNNNQYLFSIMRTEEDESSIKIYAENLNLELLNETKQPIDITTSSTLLWYLNANYLIDGSGVTIGINEVSDQTRKIKLESEQTGLARLISIANNFGAEIEFVTSLNPDGTLKSLVANFYKKYDGINYQGVGRDRQDVVLEYGRNIESITRTVDKTDIFNTIVPVGKDGVGIESIEQTEYDDKGNVEFYTKAGNKAIYAPISKQLYRAQLANDKDGWIQRYHTLDGTSDIKTLYTLGLNELRKHAYPAVTYDVKGFFDLNIGDTVRVFDSGFSPILLLKARVAQQTISFSNPSQNKTTFGNIQALENRLSKDITSRLAQLVEEATPYRFEIISSDGLTFKNSTGQTTLTARVYKGAKVDEVSVDKFEWTINGTKFGGISKNQLIKASDINGTAAVRYNATIGGVVVGGLEVTVQDVSDGAAGLPGPQGDTIYPHAAFAYSSDGVDRFTTVYPNLNILTNTKTQTYTSTGTANNNSSNTYRLDSPPLTNALLTISYDYVITNSVGTWSGFIRPTYGVGGANKYVSNANLTGSHKETLRVSIGGNTTSGILTSGLPTGTVVRIDNLKVEFGDVKTPWMPSKSEVKPSDYPSYRGEYSDKLTTQSQLPSDYKWLAFRGPTGDTGATGNGVKTSDVSYQTGASGIVTPTGTWTTSVPALIKGQYLWTRTIWTYTDNTSNTGYSVSYISVDGSRGDAGDKGLDALNLVLSNQATVIPATYDGSVQSYNGTGTRIDLTEGTTVLQYDGGGVTAGTWKVSAVVTGITCGAIVDSGAYATVANHSGMAGDSASIEYTITGKRTNGANFTIKASQSFSKSKQGIVGVSSYTWIRYSANSNGTSMTTQPGADTKYIGLYTGTSATTPTSNSDYTWSNYVGSNGADGKNGIDGDKGDPTGVTKQATEPASAQRFLGMLWQYTGTSSISITGMTATPNAIYRWIGTAWELWYFYAVNIQADTISAISGNLGTMIAGIIKVMADIVINAAGKTKKFGMLFTKKGLLSTGPTFNTAGQASDTKMAVASLTQGELRFINMDYNENLEQVQDSGTSSANNGFIRFSSTAEKGDLLEISSGGRILLDGFTTQTNAWIKLTELSYYKVMFGRVNIRVGLTSGSLRDNIYLGTVPDQYKSPNGDVMLPAQAWSINTNLDRHVQYSTNGSLYLLNPEPNTKYVFEVSYTL